MEKLLEQLKTYDWGQSRVALTEISELIKKAHGNKAELDKIEKGLLGVLHSKAKRAGKQFACRQLSLIGTEKSVSSLAIMLFDEEASDMARYALERIPGKAVDDALGKALPKAKGKMKVGIINSMGQRRTGPAGTLAKLIYDSDKMAASAAAAALGQIADVQATKALATAKSKTSGKLQMQVLDAYLKCADKLAATGKKTNALAIYRKLQNKNLPEPIQTAALRGLLNTMKGKKK